MTKMKSLWEKWKVLSAKILDKEATIILTLLYIALIAPVALVYKILADPMNINAKKKSFWFEKDTDNVSTLEKLNRQY